MSRDYIPKYRCVAHYRDARLNRRSIDLTWDGRATNKLAERRRRDLNESTKPGGCNYHLSKAEGVLIVFTKVEVVTNERNPQTVATANAPAFEVA